MSEPFDIDSVPVAIIRAIEHRMRDVPSGFRVTLQTLTDRDVLFILPPKLGWALLRLCHDLEITPGYVYRNS